MSALSNISTARCVVLAAAVQAAVAAAAHAQVFHTNAAPDQNWSTPSNWDSGVEPNSADIAIVNSGGTVIVNQAGEVAAQLIIGETPNPNPDVRSAFDLGLGGTVNVQGGTLTTLDRNLVPSISVGSGLNQTGNWVQSGGTVTTAEQFVLGYAPGSTGTFSMTNGAINVALGATFDAAFNRFDFVVGDGGTGTGTMSGGAIEVETNFAIGGASTGRGTFTLSGGAITGRRGFFVGRGAAGVREGGAITTYGGTLTQTGGAIVTAGFDNYIVGFVNLDNTRSSGRVDQSGGTVDSHLFIVGGEGDGLYNVSGGSVNARGFVTIGVQPNGGGQGPASGIVNQSGTSLVTTPGMMVGELGRGAYTISGGTLNVVGNDAPDGFDYSVGNLIVGRDGFRPLGFLGEGRFDQTGGTVNVGTATREASVFLGDLNDSNGTYTISGGALNVSGNLNVGGALSSFAAPDESRQGDQGQAAAVTGRFVVRGSAGDINIAGDLRANPADRSNTPDFPNSSTLQFDFLDASGTSLIDVLGQGDLDGALIDLNLIGAYTPTANTVFDLITAQLFGATGTGTTQNTGTGEGYILSAEDDALWDLRVVQGGRGELLQAIYTGTAIPEPTTLAALLAVAGVAGTRRRRRA